jgi:hypothetical protein
MTEAEAAMSPEERLANNLCAECSAPLLGIDVKHHSMQHWPEFIKPDGRNAEAIRRQALMTDYITNPPQRAIEKPSSSIPSKPLDRPGGSTTAPPSKL